MENSIKKFTSLHNFFIKESLSYMGKLNRKTLKYELDFKDKLYYPIAYIKFMYFSYKNI
jgi:hypothetical protein